jgi:peptide/nickel transport system ATP-binding protein
MSDSTAPLLSVHNLGVRLRSGGQWTHAVVDTSFEAPAGARVGMVGESGSGKSVSALSVLRLNEARSVRYGKSSRIVFDGAELLSLPRRAMRQLRGSRISMVFQDPMTSLNPVLRVEDQIGQVIRAHRQLDRRQAREEAAATLEMVHLREPGRVLRSFPHELSGGMVQRVMIAMAIVCRPQLLIADEPTSALDVTVQAGVLSTFRELVDRLGMTLLLISHDMSVIARTCDYVYVMYGGRVVEGGPVTTVLTQPRHPYTYFLLRCQPVMGAPVPRRLPTIPGLQQARSGPAMREGCEFAPRCQFAQERCRTTTPVLEAYGDDGRASVACHFWRDIQLAAPDGVLNGANDLGGS